MYPRLGTSALAQSVGELWLIIILDVLIVTSTGLEGIITMLFMKRDGELRSDRFYAIERNAEKIGHLSQTKPIRLTLFLYKNIQEANFHIRIQSSSRTCFES